LHADAIADMKRQGDERRRAQEQEPDAAPPAAADQAPTAPRDLAWLKEMGISL
jgi:hypothetical protein